MISIIDPRDLRQVLRPTVYAASLDELPSASPRQLLEEMRRNIASFVAQDGDAAGREEPAA